VKYVIFQAGGSKDKIVTLTQEQLDEFLNSLNNDYRWYLQDHINFRKQNTNTEIVKLLFLEREVRLLNDFFNDKFYSNLESVLK